jgi:Kdo2-lipid IVA lauroyltransferase/acyltransferase
MVLLARMLRTTALALGRTMKRALGVGAVLLLRVLQQIDPDRLANFAAAFMRRIGPFLPEHKVGRANLIAAFPEKSEAEIQAILEGVWDNLGRVGAEFAHLHSLRSTHVKGRAQGHIEFSDQDIERFQHLRDDGKPGFVFAAHLANWEVPALAAAIYGLDATIVYRRPNLGGIAEAILTTRQGHMGRLIASTPDAPFKIARALEAGSHVAMLVDQHFTNGVDVTFFGRRCKANPLLARLARHFDGPIVGVRVVRLGGRQFRAELTEALEVARDEDGRINVNATMQAVTTVIEGWVREHPEQWLWLHRRWR